MKRFIVTKNEFNPQQFCLYDVEGYGMYTWGSTSQRSICYDEELNEPYIDAWEWGGRFEDDYTEKEYLDIVDEFDTLEELKKHYVVAEEGDGVYINRLEQKRGVVQKGMIQTLKTSLDIGVVVKDEIKPKLVSGIGDKKSNGGTQYYQQDRIYDSESIAMTHPANLPGGSYKYLVNISPLRIRKLTPKECFRLMGFDDDSFEKASKVCTNTQLYKQAGNSIVVNVIQLILNQLLIVKNKKIERGVQTSIYDFIKEE